MLPVRHWRSILMLLIVKGGSGLFLKANSNKLEPHYEDHSVEDDRPFIVIVINDASTDYTNDYDGAYRSNDRKGMSIDFKPQNSTNVTLQDGKKPLEPIEDDSDENDNKRDFNGLKLTRQQKNMLRKHWRASCDRKAAMVCKKACIAASKNACRAYSCKKNIKKRFAKECKTSCKNKFTASKGGKDSDSD